MFSWAGFLSYAVVTAITPGPNNIASMSCASRLGFRKSYPFNLGILTGFSAVMLLCTLFCSALSGLLPKIKTPMLVVGAAYMLYLAWKTFRSSGELGESEAKSGYLSGVALQFVNAKIYIYGIVSMEVYILPYYQHQPGKLIFFALLLAVMGFISTVLWGLCGSAFRLLFSKYAKITNTVMALALVWCAVSLFL